MKTHIAPYVPLTMTRAEIAAWIAAGHPSSAQYRCYVAGPTPSGWQIRDVTPVHLRRA